MRIREAYGRYGADAGEKLPVKVAHDGIEDGSEKARQSFCDNGGWRHLPGAN